MPIKSTIRRHLNVVAITLSTIIAAVIIASTFLFYKDAKSDIESNAIEAVSTIALIVEPEDVYSLDGSMSDLDNATYKKLKRKFDQIAAQNDEFIFVYLMGVNSDSKTFFYVDSDNSEDQAWPGEIYDDTTSKMWQAINTGEAQFDDLGDGEDTDEWGTWISAYAPVKDDDGNVIALLGIDIDQNKYILSIVTHASFPALLGLFFISVIFFFWRSTKKKEEQLDREKELLSVASHEVRSPMVSVKWVLDDVLSRPDELSEYNKKLLTAVDDNTGKIISSINGILDSTPNWGNGHNGNEQIKAVNMFRDIIDRLALVAKEHRAVIRVDESLNDSIIIRGDNNNLNHAFYNIINNALKYNKPNTEVVISYVKIGKVHQFKISDHGPGVKLEDRERIFEGRYRTEEAVNSGQTGTGLGLYFVKRIISDHKGKIYVDPDYTNGTAFVVELPE